MNRRLLLIWLLVFCQRLHGNRMRKFQCQSKQLAAKRRAAWRCLKAKLFLHLNMFLSVALTYATSTTSQSIWTKERSFTLWERIVRKLLNVQGNVVVSCDAKMWKMSCARASHKTLRDL